MISINTSRELSSPPLPSPTASQPTLTLETSRYQAGRALGFGTFGEVFLATRREDCLQVAIKRLKNPVRGGWKNVQALKEVAAMRGIPPHRSIVQPFEVVKGTEERLYLVFEYMPDDSLYELLYRTDNGIHGPRRLTESLIQSLLRQMLSGVGHCHRHGFFHRDIKPENILLKRQPQSGEVFCKLADFSLARRYRRSSPEDGAHYGSSSSSNVQTPLPDEPPTSYISTRWYRAPEILLSSPRYSCPVDVFAVACIMAEMYELEPIFPGDSELDQVHRVFRFLGRPTMATWPEGCVLAKKANIEWPAAITVGTLKETYMAAVTGRQSGAPQATQSPLAQPLGHSAIERLSGMSKEEPASKHALSLFCGMLEINPDRRLTAHGALQHSYFASCPPKSTHLPGPKNNSTAPTRTSHKTCTASNKVSPKSVAEMLCVQPAGTRTAFRTPRRVAEYRQEDMNTFFSP